MKIIRYALCLNRLEEHQIEMLRCWRNNSFISQFMDYRGHISEEMQRIWFNKIDNLYNYFFIIEYNDVPIGLINTSNINFEEGTADTGLFIWEGKYIDSHIPVLASLSMLDVFFVLYGLKKLSAKVKNDNFKAINYNMALGFRLVSPIHGTEFSLYELTNDYYFEHAEVLRKSAEKLYGNKTEIHLNKEKAIDLEIQRGIENISVEKKQFLNLLFYNN